MLSFFLGIFWCVSVLNSSKEPMFLKIEAPNYFVFVQSGLGQELQILYAVKMRENQKVISHIQKLPGVVSLCLGEGYWENIIF